MAISAEHPSQANLRDHLKQLDTRLTRIEDHLHLPPLPGPEEEEGTSAAVLTEQQEEALELQIGQNWFARVGIVVLAIGIAFLLTFPYGNVPPVLPSLIGYVLVGGIVVLSRLLRHSFDQISRYLLGGGMLLFYFSTLRLAYFSPEPAVTNATVEHVLLLIVVALNLVVSIRRVSPYLTSMSLTMGYLAALLGSHAYFLFGVLTALSLTVVYTHRRFAWNAVLAFATVMTYFTHFVWAVNNPVLGNRLQMITGTEENLVFVLLYALIFALGTLGRGKDKPESATLGVNSFLNGFGGFGLLLILSLGAYQSHIATWHGLGSVLFLSLGIAFWIRERSLYSTFVYALLGYMALSVAIIDSFPMPDFFVWLCWESIIVLGTAVWFRSRFIVVANFGIYAIVFLAYLIAAPSVSIVSVSFGVVALLSARVLNWQKDRLTLKTEMMRNAYLASALFVIPYALFHSLPAEYVTLSWLLVALLYYIVSRVLKNRKYRWMALVTTGFAVLHVFVIDLVGLDPVYRIISFVVLGTALLVISMVYTRRKAGASSSRESMGADTTEPDS
jgi:uncharacterized membrane protein